MGWFKHRRGQAADLGDLGGLGVELIALRLADGDTAPAGATLVVFNAAGHARRLAAGRVAIERGETAFCFHPGPYTVDIAPFAAAPEWGLRLRFVIDAANPRVTRQRFDLYLHSEAEGRLTAAAFGASVEAALRAELAQGALELPPCTSLDEWHAFRAGLNQLLYTRYGVTVDDCLPVDRGGQVDFAGVLKARARAWPVGEQAPVRAPEPASAPVLVPIPVPLPAAGAVEDTASASPSLSAARPGGEAPVCAPKAPPAEALQDARALRRLFLELPALSTELRLLTLPDDHAIFQRHQALSQRLGLAALNVNTMPALAWAAPGQPLALPDQARRAAQSLLAGRALDEAWALLARLRLAGRPQWPALLDEADRICANLESALALRRLAHPPHMEPSL